MQKSKPQAIAPHSLPKDWFAKAALALPGDAPASWELYLGHKRLGCLNASDSKQAMEIFHKASVQRVLASLAADQSNDTTPLPAGKVLADYPDLIREYPNAVARCLFAERATHESLPGHERKALADFLSVARELLKAYCAPDSLHQRVQDVADRAAVLLEGPEGKSTNEEVLVHCLHVLLDQYDQGSIVGGSSEFEQARFAVETAGCLTFTTWLAGVRSLCGHISEPEEYRPYYDQGLNPSDVLVLLEHGPNQFVH